MNVDFAAANDRRGATRDWLALDERPPSRRTGHLLKNPGGVTSNLQLTAFVHRLINLRRWGLDRRVENLVARVAERVDVGKWSS